MAVQAPKVIVAQGVDADTLDPNAVFTISAQVVYSNIFDPLFTLDRDLKFVNQLVTSYNFVTPTKWRFHLRRGVTFHEVSKRVDWSPRADEMIFMRDLN